MGEHDIDTSVGAFDMGLRPPSGWAWARPDGQPPAMRDADLAALARVLLADELGPPAPADVGYAVHLGRLYRATLPFDGTWRLNPDAVVEVVEGSPHRTLPLHEALERVWDDPAARPPSQRRRFFHPDDPEFADWTVVRYLGGRTGPGAPLTPAHFPAEAHYRRIPPSRWRPRDYLGYADADDIHATGPLRVQVLRGALPHPGDLARQLDAQISPGELIGLWQDPLGHVVECSALGGETHRDDERLPAVATLLVPASRDCLGQPGWEEADPEQLVEPAALAPLRGYAPAPGSAAADVAAQLADLATDGWKLTGYDAEGGTAELLLAH